MKLNLGKQKVAIPLVVTEDAVCTQMLKDRLVLRSARPLPRGRLATVWCISILKCCANSFQAWESNSLFFSKTICRGHPLSQIRSRRNT